MNELIVVGARTDVSSVAAAHYLSEKLTRVRASVRLMTPLAQAYRAEYNGSTPRHSAKHQFWTAVNHVSPDVAKFLVDRRSPALPPSPHVLHFDIMNVLHQAPQPQLGATWASAISEKLRNMLRRHVGGNHTNLHLFAIHLHIDVPEMFPPQKTAEQRRRDKSRTASQKATHTEASRPTFSELSTPYKMTESEWAAALSMRKEKDVLASVHVALAALVALEINDEWNTRQLRELGNDAVNRNITIYCHGAAFAVHPDSVGAPLANVFVV